MEKLPVSMFSKTVLASELGRVTTLIEISDPLLDIDHNHRITLTLDKKQCGTVIPVILFMAMKLKHVVENGLTEETSETAKKVTTRIRQLLLEIRREAKDKDGAYYGKTLQEKLFRYLVLGDSLDVSKEALLTQNKKNKAHTISNSAHKTPSFTVPCYICRYLLEIEGLNPESNFNSVNPELKDEAKAVFDVIREQEGNGLSKGASFSRRVQNRITLLALNKVFCKETLKTPLIHPYY